MIEPLSVEGLKLYHSKVSKGSTQSVTQKATSVKQLCWLKEKLTFKAKEHNAVLHIVDEDYTSQTCGNCGELTKTRSKTFECSTCKTIIDRDFNGARNILLKNYKKVFVSKP